MKLKSKIVLIVLAILLSLIIIFGWIMLTQKSKVEQLFFEDIEMCEVADGTYIGAADAGLINVEVEVTVLNHKFDNIKLLKHENGLGASAEVILDKMILSDTYEVDTVSGATASSLAIKSAVCDALLKGMAGK